VGELANRPIRRNAAISRRQPGFGFPCPSSDVGHSLIW
jgi:hypothetical protein